MDYSLKMTKLLLKHKITIKKKLIPTLKFKDLLYNWLFIMLISKSGNENGI